MSKSASSNENPVHSNRLAREKSPYLLQHAHNPVDWYPWSAEAFEKATRENKPVFLSIGYSTCHWCLVMERESFEDAQSAQIFNENFIAIKVDREERPDIDSVYMSYVTTTTGSGGWPMSVFLTPDKKPFYGGTYFPPQDRYGMPGFKTLLLSIADAWKNRKDEIIHSADSATTFLNKPTETKEKPLLDAAVLDKAFAYYESSFDSERGGFGGAPKFPRSHALSFLLRYWKRTGSEKSLEMVKATLDAMKDGGIYDQLGGGFHRYSTDNAWRIPHFEKMLYDQALLAKTYAEAYQATQNPEYASTTRETLDYVLEGMTSPEGGFYSAEDADSQDLENPKEKKEGAFFLWKKDEIEKLLEPKAAEIFISFYGVTASGNALSDPHHEFVDKNVLYRAGNIVAAPSFKMSPAEVTKSLEASRKILLNTRGARPHPYKDDKILADWNGLMIESFAKASVVLSEPRYAQAAIRAAEFISGTLKDTQGRLLHRFRDGEANIRASLNDYAFMTAAYVVLYEAVGDKKWLESARQTASEMIKLFQDEERGGFYLTAHDAEALITRPKEVYDGAVPSGNSVAACALLALERATGETSWRKVAEKILDTFSTEISQTPANFTQMLAALDEAMGPPSICRDETCSI